VGARGGQCPANGRDGGPQKKEEEGGELSEAGDSSGDSGERRTLPNSAVGGEGERVSPRVKRRLPTKIKGNGAEETSEEEK